MENSFPPRCELLVNLDFCGERFSKSVSSALEASQEEISEAIGGFVTMVFGAYFLIIWSRSEKCRLRDIMLTNLYVKIVSQRVSNSHSLVFSKIKLQRSKMFKRIMFLQLFQQRLITAFKVFVLNLMG